MDSTEPRQVHPLPPPPAEQIDRLILDLRCALDRKRVGGTGGCGYPFDRKLPPADRALWAETAGQREHALSHRLCLALQDIVEACESDTAPAARVTRIVCLAQAALAQAQHSAS